MEMNTYDDDRAASYEYDKRVPWIPQQNQYYDTRNTAARAQPTRQQPSHLQNQRPQQKGGTQGQKPKPMPKARTLALVHTFKKWLVVASFVGFGTLSGLAAFHQIGTTTTATASQTKHTASSSSQTKSTTSSSSTFLNQQGGSNIGTGSTSGTGSSSSSTSGTGSSSSSSSSPVSGSQTS